MAHPRHDRLAAIKLIILEFTDLEPPPCFLGDRREHDRPAAFHVIWCKQTRFDLANFGMIYHLAGLFLAMID